MLPEGYRCRPFMPGDEAAWERIIGEAFGWGVSPGKFNAEMRADPEFRPERVLFVCRGDEPVGTASACAARAMASTPATSTTSRC